MFTHHSRFKPANRNGYNTNPVVNQEEGTKPDSRFNRERDAKLKRNSTETRPAVNHRERERESIAVVREKKGHHTESELSKGGCFVIRN